MRERVEAECGSVVPQLKGENAFAANAISEALQEFQLRVEQLLIDEEVKFEEGPQGVAAKIEARKRALRALRDALEQESTQWSCMLEGSAKTVTAESPAIDTSELRTERGWFSRRGVRRHPPPPLAPNRGARARFSRRRGEFMRSRRARVRRVRRRHSIERFPFAPFVPISSQTHLWSHRRRRLESLD